MPEAPETEAEAEALRAAAEELLKLKNSTGWKILMAQFAADREQARDQLETVNPEDRSAVEHLQAQAARYRDYTETIDTLMGQGFETENLEEDELDYD